MRTRRECAAGSRDMTGGGRRRRESETSAAAAAATGTTVVAAAASTTSGAGGWTGAEESRARDRREQSIRRRGAAGRYRRTNQTAASWPLATAPGTEEYTGVAVLWGPTADEEYGVASTTAASTTGAAEPWTMNPSTDGTTLGVSERVTMAGPHTEPSPRLSSSVSERGPAVLGTAGSPSGSQDDGADFVEDGGLTPQQSIILVVVILSVAFIATLALRIRWSRINLRRRKNMQRGALWRPERMGCYDFTDYADQPPTLLTTPSRACDSDALLCPYVDPVLHDSGTPRHPYAPLGYGYPVAPASPTSFHRSSLQLSIREAAQSAALVRGLSRRTSPADVFSASPACMHGPSSFLGLSGSVLEQRPSPGMLPTKDIFPVYSTRQVSCSPGCPRPPSPCEYVNLPSNSTPLGLPSRCSQPLPRQAAFETPLPAAPTHNGHVYAVCCAPNMSRSPLLPSTRISQPRRRANTMAGDVRTQFEDENGSPLKIRPPLSSQSTQEELPPLPPSAALIHPWPSERHVIEREIGSPLRPLAIQPPSSLLHLNCNFPDDLASSAHFTTPSHHSPLSICGPPDFRPKTRLTRVASDPRSCVSEPAAPTSTAYRDRYNAASPMYVSESHPTSAAASPRTPRPRGRPGPSATRSLRREPPVQLSGCNIPDTGSLPRRGRAAISSGVQRRAARAQHSPPGAGCYVPYSPEKQIKAYQALPLTGDSRYGYGHSNSPAAGFAYCGQVGNILQCHPPAQPATR